MDLLIRERGAALWLEGRRLRDLRRWLANGRISVLLAKEHLRSDQSRGT